MRPVHLCALSLLQVLLPPAHTLSVPPGGAPQAVLRHLSTREADQRMDPSSSQEPEQAGRDSRPLSEVPSSSSGDVAHGLVSDASGTLHDNGEDPQEPDSGALPSGKGEPDWGRPRAIVDVRRDGVGGEVSYIIHPDNQPPPSYEPLKDLPPPTRPVAKWRPDIFMKICCSEPEPDASSDDGSGDFPESAVTSPDPQGDEATDQISTLPDEEEENTANEKVSVEEIDEGSTTTLMPDDGGDSPSTQRSSYSDVEGMLAPLDSSEAARPEHASNHTPRYEEGSTSPYQDVVNFLRDIASSEGFQNAFLGDLIKNFGSLDQNALKLIYSLLIRPLEENYRKEDKVRAAEDGPPVTAEVIMSPEDMVVLSRDRLPLRDRPDNGFQPLKTSFLQSRPSEGSRYSIRPSLPMQPVSPSFPIDEAWRPGRTYDRPQPVRRLGEMVDVITAPPAKTFEVVLGSSLRHDDKQHREGGGDGSVRTSRPPSPAGGLPLPFDKLTLGLEMPPPEALEALPPGSILIPPSHIVGRPKLPKILPPRNGGASTLEMPLAELLPNLPFLPKPPRPRPPVQPKVQDIPPRLPGFLSSLGPTAAHPAPTRPPRPAVQPPPQVNTRLQFPFALQPTGPPPIVTKMTPPTVPTVPFRRPHHLSSSASLSPFLAPPPPPPPLPSPSPPLPPRSGAVSKEYDHSLHTPVNVESLDRFDESVGGHVREDHRQSDYVADRNEDYQVVLEAVNSEGHHHHHQPHADYYSEVPSDYLSSYYDLDYEEYYEENGESRAEQEPPSGGSGLGKQRPVMDEASTTFLAADQPRSPAAPPTMGTTPPSLNQHLMGGQSEDHFPAGTDGPLVHYQSLDDLLGVVKPNFSTSTAKGQNNYEFQSFLQNHRPAAALPEEDIGADMVPEQDEEATVLHPLPAAENEVTPAQGDLWTVLEPHQVGEERWGVPDGEEEALSPSDVEHRKHDASVSHLWKNVQLIPLTPDLFETPDQPEDKDAVNLTSLFDAAVPLAPDATLDLVPDLSSDVDRIMVDHNGVRVTITEDVLENPDQAEAKFMAYILIGACCGLALLSITGVIVIVRFKKTCGSRQIKTRTRLTEQDSVENISRHVSQLTPAEESGHKLGSWFTGRNEHIGSGKLRGNMALPAVHNHKMEKKGHSSSTRDLLSISSQSSPSISPPQERRDGEVDGQTGEDESRGSWLHGEYRASEDEMSHSAAGHDPQYYPEHQQTRSSPLAASTRRHSTDHLYRAGSAAEVDPPPRGARERRYTGQSREEERPPRSPSRRGPRYLSSMESEELEDRLEGRGREYRTESELDDVTTHYDGESREPSRYFSDSRELDDVVSGRRTDHPCSMTSQELGEHISRDLKQYQSRREGRAQHQLQAEEVKEPWDPARGDQSSHEVKGEESRELRRSQSQVSFSRDNVQNEVFLEFDSMLRQHGQYLASEPPASTLGRASLFTNDTRLSASRANTPDSIDLPEDFPQGVSSRQEGEHPTLSPPTTPPRFSPPLAPPRPPKPGHLSQAGTPSPQAGRGRPPSPGHSPPSPPSSSHRPVYWTSEEERLI